MRSNVATFDVVGHDWGARAAYTMAALFPQRVRRIAALALAFQPRGAFELPGFSQARKFWYQWFMTLDDAPSAIRADPKGFARIQWDTWSPPGWFDDAEFDATARAFDNPDWVPITLNGYRRRWRKDEASDPAYAELYARLATIDRIATPTLMLQGAVDLCDEPESSEGKEGCFTGGYERLVLEGAGHFPLRETPDAVARCGDRAFALRRVAARDGVARTAYALFARRLHERPSAIRTHPQTRVGATPLRGRSVAMIRYMPPPITTPKNQPYVFHQAGSRS